MDRLFIVSRLATDVLNLMAAVTFRSSEFGVRTPQFRHLVRPSVGIRTQSAHSGIVLVQTAMADDAKSNESREEIIGEFNERRQEVQALVQKITQLDGDRMEHE